MADGLAWTEVAEAYEAEVEQLRAGARGLYDLMAAHLRAETERTGAEITLMAPGSVLPKEPAVATIAMRMDVTPATALYARQPHASEGGRERHRSWPVDLAPASSLPRNVAAGLTRVVEEVARLQALPVQSDAALPRITRKNPSSAMHHA